MAQKMIGYYKQESTENADEYMKAVNMSYLIRKGVSMVTFYIEIIQDGDNWQLNYLSTFKNQKTSFKFGETFPYKTGDGRSFKVCFTEEDGKIVQRETVDAAKNIPSVFTYEFENGNEDLLLVTATAIIDGSPIIMKRRFSRQKK